jgi:cytochrome c5
MKKLIAIAALFTAATIPASAQNAAPSTLPEGPGKPLVERMCVGCHSLKVVTSKHATKDRWSAIVQQMVSRGAEGTDDEIATVIDYLAANYPPLPEDKTPDKPADKSTPPPAASLTAPKKNTQLAQSMQATVRMWEHKTSVSLISIAVPERIPSRP